MKKSDFQLIGYIGTVLGVLFLCAGAIARVYEVDVPTIFGTFATYPYAQYSGSLLVAGIVLLVIGLAFLWRAEQEPPIPPPPPPLPAKE